MNRGDYEAVDKTAAERFGESQPAGGCLACTCALLCITAAALWLAVGLL